MRGNNTQGLQLLVCFPTHFILETVRLPCHLVSLKTLSSGLRFGRVAALTTWVSTGGTWESCAAAASLPSPQNPPQSFSHVNGCEVVSDCGFTLHFPDNCDI